MVSFREAREALGYAFLNRIINIDEFALLYDLNTSKNLDYPYWNYDHFDLDRLSDEECWSSFRFYKRDIYDLKGLLHIPDQITTYNRCKVDGLEALCICFDRFAYPCRYSSMIPRYGRPVTQLSMISNQVMMYIYEQLHPSRESQSTLAQPSQFRDLL